jgi:hypothetical protein
MMPNNLIFIAFYFVLCKRMSSSIYMESIKTAKLFLWFSVRKLVPRVVRCSLSERMVQVAYPLPTAQA